MRSTMRVIGLELYITMLQVTHVCAGFKPLMGSTPAALPTTKIILTYALAIYWTRKPGLTSYFDILQVKL
jgi:hypothetical protein